MDARPLRRLHIVFAVMTVFWTATASGQPLSFTRDDYAAYTGARAMVAADLNRDGWMDLATADAGRNTVTVLRNADAAGGFTVLRDTPVGAGPFAMAAGDLDRDGVTDLVVTTPDAKAIDLLYSRADGTLRSRMTLTGTGASRGIALADVTRDGRLDLIYTDYDRNAVFIRPGTSTGFAAPLPAIAVGSHPQDVAAGDVNHDGYVDLAVANTGEARVTILHGHADTTFTRVNLTAPVPVNVLLLADLNNDGWPDLAAASTSANRIVLYRDGPSGLAMTSMASGISPRGLAVADVNSDGRPDLLAANRSSSTVTLWLGITGTTLSFTKWGELAAGSGSRALAASDFDNDGRIDFASANEYAANVTQFTNGTAFLPAAFSFHRQTLAGPFNYGPVRKAVADFNENGRPDLVLNSDVLLDGQTLVALPALSQSVDRIVTADLNRDGHTDIALTEPAGWVQGRYYTSLTILLGDGRGGFTRRFTDQTLFNADELRVADMNRDGIPDVVVEGYDDVALEGILWVFTGTGTGEFTVRALQTPTWANGFAVADMDRDGAMDIAVSFYRVAAARIYFGDGHGWFSSNVELPLPYPTLSLAVADANADGRPDLLVGSDPPGWIDPDVLAVVLATGSRTWGTPATYPSGTIYTALAADMNHDGTIDIVSWEGIIPGNGNGTFGTPQMFTFWDPQVVTDWNHDGLLDLISDDASAILNERNGTNHPPVASIASYIQGSISYDAQFFEDIADLNGTGSTDPDLHAVSYEWRDESGTVLASNPYGWYTFPPQLPGPNTFYLTVRDGRGGEDTTSFSFTVTPFKEIVMWAQGTTREMVLPWQTVEDASAAGGRRYWYPNAGAAKAAAPAATPSSYVDIVFTPDPTLAYKLWVRGKAQNNSPYNDSVWMQFDGATNTAGQPVYRIGTTSGLAVNLEECSGCGLSGWGWEDDGWGAVNRNGTLLRFPQGGSQTIRLQIREDGFSIDQIVLSAEKYLTARPGTAKGDTTIVPQTQFWQ